MPRGGHNGLWKPTPIDIFKSRWKRFYKHCYRPRSRANQPDRAGPHDQPRVNNDGVPSPWRLLYSLHNFTKNSLPPDVKPRRILHYRDNERQFLKPLLACNNVDAMDVVLRGLDPGRRQGADSGYGRLETQPWPKKDGKGAQDAPDFPEHFPEHIYKFMKAGHTVDTERQEAEQKAEDTGRDFFECLMGKFNADPGHHSGTFPVRRLQELVEEWEIVWEEGQNDPRRSSRAGRSEAEEGVDRGHFPYIDEKASLIDDLTLKEILRLNYKTKSRRHPKWKEIQYEYQKGHRQYLRRRQMLLDESKARMNVIRNIANDS